MNSEKENQQALAMDDLSLTEDIVKDLEAAAAAEDVTDTHDHDDFHEETTSKPESFASVCTDEQSDQEHKDEENGRSTTPSNHKKRLWIVLVAVLIIAVVIVAVAVPLSISRSSDESDTESQQPDLPEPLPEFYTLEGHEMMNLIHTYLPRRAFNDSTTTQSKALSWILYNDTFFRDSFTLDSLYISLDDRKLRRYALAALWFAGGDVTKEGDEYSNSTWFVPIDECEWISRRASVDCVPGSPQNFNLELGDSFTGTIPPELGLLTGMKIFRYDRESQEEVGIAGTIPTEIGLLTDTEHFMMFGNADDNYNDNQKFGPLPSEIGQMTSLVNLMIDEMQLVGSLPTEIGLLTQMQTLAVRGNQQLNGPIPSETGLMTSLHWLILERNAISGQIPNEIGQLSLLKILRINDNEAIVGSIPSEVGQLELLTEFRADENAITGPLPLELGQLRNLEILDIHNNQIGESIPPEWEGGFDSIMYMDLRSNNLKGSIPSTFGSFGSLHADSTSDAFYHLDLSYNDLSGPVPPELGRLTDLETLILDNNSLTSTIPKELQNAENLKILRIENNDIVGTIPEGLCTFPARGDDMSAIIVIDCEKVECPAVDDCFCLSGDNDFPTSTYWDYLDLVDRNNDDILRCPVP